MAMSRSETDRKINIRRENVSIDLAAIQQQLPQG